MRVRVEPNESGLTADLVFGARSPVVEEPRFTLHDGATAVFDYTRLTQWGAWDGTLGIDGEDAADHARPRSSAAATGRGACVRSARRRPGRVGSGRSSSGCGRRSTSTTCACTSTSTSYGDGRQWHSEGLVMPVLSAPTDPVFGPDVRIETMASVRADVRWKPGTRRSEGATIHLVPHRGEERVVTLEPLSTFHMRGLGYLHPEFGHGHWKGDLAVHADRWKVDDFTGVDPVPQPPRAADRAGDDGRAGRVSVCSSSWRSVRTSLRASPSCSTARASHDRASAALDRNTRRFSSVVSLRATVRSIQRRGASVLSATIASGVAVANR